MPSLQGLESSPWRSPVIDSSGRERGAWKFAPGCDRETAHDHIGWIPRRTKGEGFAHTQAFTLRNVSNEPVLGPLHLVLRAPASAPGTAGAGFTAHPAVLDAFGDPIDGLEGQVRFASVEALPTRDAPRVPGTVLAPGEAISVELLVTDRVEHAREGVEARGFRSLRPL